MSSLNASSPPATRGLVRAYFILSGSEPDTRIPRPVGSASRRAVTRAYPVGLQARATCRVGNVGSSPFPWRVGGLIPSARPGPPGKTWARRETQNTSNRSPGENGGRPNTSRAGGGARQPGMGFTQRTPPHARGGPNRQETGVTVWGHAGLPSWQRDYTISTKGS